MTYSSTDGTVVAISGFRGGGSEIFYQRDVVTAQTIYSLQWLYPTTESRYKAMIDHTAQTFYPDPAPG